jgi:tRNA(Ile)-lysidine synthase
MSRAGRTLLERVRRTITEECVFPREARVLVGVSGGPDSIVLLHLLSALQARLGLTLHAVHVDHQLRRDSAQDGAFVRQFAQRLGVDTTVVARDVRAEQVGAGRSLEDAARRARYEVFGQVACRVGAAAVAVAHTADDQAETVLMRLLQGAGPEGLAGMPFARPLSAQAGAPRLVRPLLRCWRREVLAHAAQARLPVRHDPTNRDERFLRNRIRHELLPLLEGRYNPKIRAALVQLARVCRMQVQWLEDEELKQWKRVAKRQGPHRVLLGARRLLRQPAVVRRALVVRALEAVRPHGCRLEFRHWEGLEELLRARPEGSVVDLPGGARWGRRHGQLWCEAKPGIL